MTRACDAVGLRRATYYRAIKPRSEEPPEPTPSQPAPTGALLWTDRFGTSVGDNVLSVATDASGNVFVAGFTYGALDGGISEGGADAFVRKYDSFGVEQWTVQFGTDSHDFGHGVATDDQGHVYCVGRTDGAFEGADKRTSVSAFVRKYDSQGNELWTEQFGAAEFYQAKAVSTDQLGNVFVAGSTSSVVDSTGVNRGAGAFVRKYIADGAPKWTREFPTDTFEGIEAVAADGSGGVFAVGAAAIDLETGEPSAGTFSGFVTHLGP